MITEASRWTMIIRVCSTSICASSSGSEDTNLRVWVLYRTRQARTYLGPREGVLGGRTIPCAAPKLNFFSACPSRVRRYRRRPPIEVPHPRLNHREQQDIRILGPEHAHLHAMMNAVMNIRCPWAEGSIKYRSPRGVKVDGRTRARTRGGVGRASVVAILIRTVRREGSIRGEEGTIKEREGTIKDEDEEGDIKGGEHEAARSKAGQALAEAVDEWRENWQTVASPSPAGGLRRAHETADER
ncbi:hypothetical protein GGG16DRAFT_99408 [Schizophyllum commune]